MIKELMGIGIESLKVGWSLAARPCDSCKSAGAAVFCRIDSVFLCLPCDTRIHCLAPHERVWVCEVCEHAPAAVTCKADAAALCVTCDADIHSANPLARRHERVPVEPFFESAGTVAKCPIGLLDLPVAGEDGHQEDLGACSWLIQNDFNQIDPKISIESSHDLKSGDFVLSDFERLIDFEYDPNSVQNPNSRVNDGLVPVQTKPEPVQFMNNQEHGFDIGFCKSTLSSFSCHTAQSHSHSISSSSLDFGVVPDGTSSMSDFSWPMSQNVSNGSNGSAVSGGATNESASQQLSGIDREARVLRYREKRKNRKFEKTIRYASRKAYAESRPRVKGRFAKRTDVQNGSAFAGRKYGTTAHAGSGYIVGNVSHYGVVPSF